MISSVPSTAISAKTEALTASMLADLESRSLPDRSWLRDQVSGVSLWNYGSPHVANVQQKDKVYAFLSAFEAVTGGFRGLPSGWLIERGLRHGVEVLRGSGWEAVEGEGDQSRICDTLAHVQLLKPRLQDGYDHSRLVRSQEQGYFERHAKISASILKHMHNSTDTVFANPSQPGAFVSVLRKPGPSVSYGKLSLFFDAQFRELARDCLMSPLIWRHFRSHYLSCRFENGYFVEGRWSSGGRDSGSAEFTGTIFSEGATTHFDEHARGAFAVFIQTELADVSL